MHAAPRCAALALALATSSAFAIDLTAAQASRIIDGCTAHAKDRHQSHAVVVDDAGGHPVAVLRMDGNPSGILDFAMQKAQAVAAWRFSTQQMATAAKDTPGFAQAPHVVTVAGGVPVYSADGQFIGAVGVSGEAPADDAACAEAGVAAAGLLTAPRKKS